MSWCVIAVLAALSAAPADRTTTEDIGAVASPADQVSVPAWTYPRDVLYDNGPFVTHTGTGVGGADESWLQSSLLMSAYGFNHTADASQWVAEDFTVPTGRTWGIGSVTLFAYQTGAATAPSTMTAVHIQIWDDVPGTPSATLVYGDEVTNRLTSSEWTSCYRVPDTASGGNSQRPIMANTCELAPPAELGAGTYWIAWQSSGSLTSGPWVPPITIMGQTTTGNALQSTNGGVSYAPVVDFGTSTPQGLPFVLETDTPVERTTWGAVKALYR
jgi:hypothetical protein